MEKKVFWSGIEYSYLESSKKFKNLQGGFVFIFIKAYDVREALAKIEKELTIIKLEPIEIEFIKPYEKELEWETPEQTEHYLSLYEESDSKNKTVFDTFYAYEHE